MLHCEIKDETGVLQGALHLQPTDFHLLDWKVQRRAYSNGNQGNEEWLYEEQGALAAEHMVK